MKNEKKVPINPFTGKVADIDVPIFEAEKMNELEEKAKKAKGKDKEIADIEFRDYCNKVFKGK